MSKVYDYEACQQVIKDAWDVAVQHLKDTLGDQYEYNATKYGWWKFQDYIDQDITPKKQCPVCGTVDIEGNFNTSEFEPECDICWDCYQDELGK